TASVLFGEHYVSPILLEYLNAYPEVTVEAVFLDRVVNVVEEGFDIAVRIGSLPDSSLIASRVGEVRKVVCGSHSYLEERGCPQTPSDLADHDVIAIRPLGPPSKWRFGQQTSVTVNPRLTFSSVPPAIAAATSGWGLTRVLSYQIGPELGASRLTTVLNEFEPTPLPIHLMHAEGRGASAKVRAFVELAAKRLRNHTHLQS
ncbi:MAG: DNA-binding transcriptional LysR family regulator, partial [Bradymonadia bacterium]